MTSSFLIVTVDLSAARGQEPALARRFAEMRAAVHALPDPHRPLCYEFSRDEADPARFFVYEEWRDRAHFDSFHAHHRPAEVRQFLADVPQLLAAPPHIRLLQPL